MEILEKPVGMAYNGRKETTGKGEDIPWRFRARN